MSKYYVTANLLARVHGATNVTLKTSFFISARSDSERRQCINEMNEKKMFDQTRQVLIRKKRETGIQ